eukprot:130648_1
MAPRKQKFRKDPDAPKRSTSGYFLFTKATRATVVKEHPDWKVTEVAKKLGGMWGELSDSDKKPYLEEAAKLKAAYTIKRKAYDASEGKKVYLAEKKAWTKEKKRAAKAALANDYSDEYDYSD